MLNRLRRCIAADDGVTVVESMFAIVVLMVALFGLMGGLIATAQSQLSQRQETLGTRVANEFLERHRSSGFDTLKADMLANCPAGSTCEPKTATRNGTTYTINTVLREMEAGNNTRWRDAAACAPAGCPTPGRPTVMEATATTTWTVKGRTRTVQSTSTVSPVKPDLTKDIKGITVFPSPAIVAPVSPGDFNPPGMPTQDILITVELKGLDAATPVSVSWTDDQGVKGPFPLTTTNAKTWTRTLTRAQIRKAIPVDDETSELEFLVEVGIGGGITLRQQQTVRLVRAVDPPIIAAKATPTALTKTWISPYNPNYITTIPIVRTGPAAGRGRNSVPVVFSAEVVPEAALVSNGVTPLGTVRAWWQNQSGTWIAADLTWNATTRTWRREIPTNGQDGFPTNAPSITIYFQSTRTSDGVTHTRAIPVNLS